MSHSTFNQGLPTVTMTHSTFQSEVTNCSTNNVKSRRAALNFGQSLKYAQNTFGNNVQSWTIFIKHDEIEVPQGVK